MSWFSISINHPKPAAAWKSLFENTLVFVSRQEKLGGNIPLWIKYHKWEFYLAKCFLLIDLENIKKSRNFIENMEGNM